MCEAHWAEQQSRKILSSFFEKHNHTEVVDRTTPSTL